MKREIYEHIIRLLRACIAGTDFEGHAYAVGGCVRDRRLSNEIKDIDLVVDFPNGGIELAKFMKDGGYVKGSPVVYENYGTVMFRLREYPDIEIEAVQTRKEDYHDAKTRNPVTCFGTIEDDCRRRDFTINALYYDISADREIDFNGNSLFDLGAKVIDTCGDPEIIFDEDPLRILRAVRFAARLGYTISDRTKEGMKRFAYRLEIISQERITDEFNKILSGPNPEAGMEMLCDFGLLIYVLPESTFPVMSRVGYVKAGMHRVAMMAKRYDVDQLLPELTYLSTLTDRDAFRNAMIRMKYSNEMTDKVHLYAELQDMLDEAAYPVSKPAMHAAEYRAKTMENYKVAFVVHKAESFNSEIPLHWPKLDPREPHPMLGYRLPVDGNDVMELLGIPPGPEVKKTLDALLREAFRNPDITRDECIALILKKKDKDNDETGENQGVVRTRLPHSG